MNVLGDAQQGVSEQHQNPRSDFHCLTKTILSSGICSGSERQAATLKTLGQLSINPAVRGQAHRDVLQRGCKHSCRAQRERHSHQPFQQTVEVDMEAEAEVIRPSQLVGIQHLQMYGRRGARAWARYLHSSPPTWVTWASYGSHQHNALCNPRTKHPLLLL